ncbi:kinesin-related protein 4-like isoform X2 [Nylanderia fulva]|uniref:kinesin-related protein 4-like isoform X2 n=1 Tax=Nylanderia fulva TaxID=613905 RepID=UPI0010FB7388|nr:kinesin-related protein 4-like isoform X2 [Nylanderia fulva]
MSDSIKVAIKVRPLIRREKEESLPIQWIVQENNIVATDVELRKRGDGGFQFDHIFDTHANNNNVFDTIVKPIVDAAVNGFNGTVFAYGQTSSGKTYTMMGTSEEPGVIPLAVEHMFDAIANTSGREFLLRVSYLEIYNEKVRDLLSKSSDLDLKIHEDVNGQVFVKCKEEVTNCPENVLSLMHKGNKHRRIGETNMNERSSRSHTIFRITIESREAGAASDGAIQVSQLNMVDLAGSEKARQTGATGERFKEGCRINLSLSTLALVIKQLSESPDSQKYINFRDSKLTRLLQASLGGNAMTVIICAVTPAALDETQCTLSFASRARNIKNKPELNEVMSDGVLLKRYAKQIDILHAELERVKQQARSTDLEEMESKMQEKDRINQNLEERIRLLQTRIVHGDNRNNTESFKNKVKRRQTWGGTAGYKLNTFQTCRNLSPIKEMSPFKSHRKSTEIMNTFQIALADFELELMNNEEDCEEEIITNEEEEMESNDEDTFLIYRKHNHVKFTDDVIIHKLPSINYNHDTLLEKIDKSMQTESDQSPDTQEKILLDRIQNLSKELSQLREFTTLEKQLCVEDYFEIKGKLVKLEKQLENTISERDSYEHIASDRLKKLTATESRYALVEDKLNAQAAELQRIPDFEKKIAQLSAQKIEMQNVFTAEKDGYEHVASELQKKLNEAEQRNIMLEDKLAIQNVSLEQFLSQNAGNVQQIELENQITAITFQNNELQHMITGLQNKLTETELCKNLMKDQLDEQQQTLQNFQDQKERIDNFMSKNNEFEHTICELQNKLKEVQEDNISMRNKLNAQQIEIQKFENQEKQIEHLVSENNEFKHTISELQEQLIEAEIRNNTIEDNDQNTDIDTDKLHLEKQIQDVVKEKMESERINGELRDKLKEIELINNSIKNQQEIYVQNTSDLQKQVEDFANEKNKFEGIIVELTENLKEEESINSSLKHKLNEYETNMYDPDSTEKEHIISKMQKKLKETELHNNSMKEELNMQRVEAQKTIDEQKKLIEDLIINKNELQDLIYELQQKLKRMELQNELIKNRINEQELQLQKNHDLEKDIEYRASETKKLESVVHELQEKLTHTELCISTKDESNEQFCLENIQESEEVARFTEERDEYEDISMKLHRKSNGKKSTLDQSNDNEINYLKSHINDLQGIQDMQKENTYFKEEASARSILNPKCDLINGDSSKIIDLSISLNDSTKLSTDFFSKTPEEKQEISEMVQGLKTDIQNLESTISVLTMENSELTDKLSEEKEYSKKSAAHFQQTIDELYARNSKIIDENLELKNNLTILSEEMKTLRSKIPEVNSSEEEIILKYEEQINELTAKNAVLLSNVTDSKKDLEIFKESKALLYEHDCMHKDKLCDLTEQYQYLKNEHNQLSIDLMDKIEENDGLKEECEILKNKLELLLKHAENSNDAEQLRMENTLLRSEQVELKTNIQILTKENSQISNQLVETIEDLDNVRKVNSCNNTFHLSTLFNNTLTTSDSVDKSTKDGNAEAIISHLQEEVDHVTLLNRKLSDLKLGPCTQCAYLQEMIENKRELKLREKTLTHKIEDLQRKFDCVVAKSDPLILKAKEDVNISVCNSSLNGSFLEIMNVSCVEERLQFITNKLQSLKEEHEKLSDLYKEKCNEVEELQNSSVMNLSPNKMHNVNTSVKKSPNKTLRLDNVEKTTSNLQNDLDKLKEVTEGIKTDMGKFTEKENTLLDEIKSLKNTNEQLLQKLSENELLYLEKTDILENEIKDMTKKLQEFSVRYKEIEHEKLIVETEVEFLKTDKAAKEETINELCQKLSDLQHELDLTKREKEQLNLLEQEYEKKLESLRSMNEELTNSKETISQEFASYSKESENRFTELNEKVNKYTAENDYLKQELIKLRDIENEFETMRNEYQYKSQQDKTLADDNKKLKNVLNNTSKNIISEIKSLKPKVSAEEFQDKSVDELFQIFLHTILVKEQEIVKSMADNFNREKQKLEDDKRQSVDAEKRTTLWAKELESEIDKLQADLSQREAASNGLQKEVWRLEKLLQENNRDQDTLREKISLLEMDLNNMQIEYNKCAKLDTVSEEAINIAQKRERQAQEAIRNKEAEFQMKMKSEKEAYNKRIEDLACTIEAFKSKNMDLTGTIEGLEANKVHLQNIIGLKNNELMKLNQIMEMKKIELAQLVEGYQDLNCEFEKRNLRIEEITELLKTKCDDLTEYKAKLDTIMSENTFLKQQIGERKTSIEQYKLDIEKLKTDNKKEIDAIKDELNFEELKNIELRKQMDALNNTNTALTEDMNTLRDNYATLQHKCITLEKRIRNSTSRILAEEQMEELKDLNRSLRNNLDGASNRITELQDAKAELTKQLITLNSQYDAACKENEELKEMLSSYRSKYDTHAFCEKYDALLQEKNKIALELEAIKVELDQKSKDIENYVSEVKGLKEKNAELDQESEELAQVICQHDAENAKIEDQLWACRIENDELRDKIKGFENQIQDPQDIEKAKSRNDDCSCTELKNKIRELQMEIISKNGKIATLELQIRNGSFPYQTKCTELQEHLSAYKNKTSELRAEIKRLQTAMIRTSARECHVCKQRLLNKRDQICQTTSNNILRFCGTSSGIIEDEIRITKLEKEKQFMKDVCRSRSKTIKELEKQVEEYEKLLRFKKSYEKNP